MEDVASMTGYGRGSAAGGGRELVVELRAVNHRFCEVVVRGPRELMALEDRVRREVSAQVKRGRVEVGVTVRWLGDRPQAVAIDKSLAMAYYGALKELAGTVDVATDVSVRDLAALPGVVVVEQPIDSPDDVWQPYGEALAAALDGLVAMRRREGQALKADLVSRMANLERCRELIAERAPGVVKEYRSRLEARLGELLAGPVVDEARLAQEVAAYADRCNVDEELARLGSHLDQFRVTLDEEGAIGRKLEFLLQELNREINTIGSKSQDIEIAQAVVAAKGELEKMREQAQNIE